MSAILALLPVLFQYLPTAVSGVEHLIAWIESLRATAQQSGEWTADLEAAFVASLIALGKSKAFQPDSPAPVAALVTANPPSPSSGATRLPSEAGPEDTSKPVEQVTIAELPPGQ